MQKYYDLEVNILSCLLQKPELMKQIKFEDKHFIKYQQLWQFMKAFYKKYGTFDLILMYNVSNNKYKIIQYMEYLINVEPCVSMFDEYQDLLIEQYNENKKEKIMKQKIFEIANELYTNNITIEEFELKLKKIKENI